MTPGAADCASRCSFAPRRRVGRLGARQRGRRRSNAGRDDPAGDHGARGIVAGGRNYSVAAGSEMFERGGNAVDAGVATVFARVGRRDLSHFGFGGECPLMIYDAKTQKVVVINGQGRRRKPRRRMLFKAKGKVDANGPLAATVPAVLDALAIALSRVRDDAPRAGHGARHRVRGRVPMYAFLRDYLVPRAQGHGAVGVVEEDLLPGGKHPRGGRDLPAAEPREDAARDRRSRAARRSRRRATGRPPSRPAATPSTRDRSRGGSPRPTGAAGGVLSDEGPRRASTAGSRSRSGAYFPRLRRLQGRDRGTRARCSSRSSISSRDSTSRRWARDSADARPHGARGDQAGLRRPQRVLRRSRLREGADLTGLLSADYAASRRKLIGAEAFLDHRPGDPFAFDPDVKAPPERYAPHSQGKPPRAEPGDTTCVDAVDADGNLFSATPSSSGWLLGGPSSRATRACRSPTACRSSTSIPTSPNVLAGGKRPRTTLTPTILVKGWETVPRDLDARRRTARTSRSPTCS